MKSYILEKFETKQKIIKAVLKKQLFVLVLWHNVHSKLFKQ